MVLCCIALLSPWPANAGEREVLLALEKMKSSVEQGVSYDAYEKLLSDIKTALDALKKEGSSNSCFMTQAELCHTYYYLGLFNWKSMLKADEEVRKQEVRDLRNAAWMRAKERLEMAHECMKERHNSDR